MQLLFPPQIYSLEPPTHGIEPEYLYAYHPSLTLQKYSLSDCNLIIESPLPTALLIPWAPCPLVWTKSPHLFLEVSLSLFSSSIFIHPYHSLTCRNAPYQVIHGHNVFLRSREDNRNQRTEQRPRKTRPDIHTWNHLNHFNTDAKTPAQNQNH